MYKLWKLFIDSLTLNTEGSQYNDDIRKNIHDRKGPPIFKISPDCLQIVLVLS